MLYLLLSSGHTPRPPRRFLQSCVPNHTPAREGSLRMRLSFSQPMPAPGKHGIKGSKVLIIPKSTPPNPLKYALQSVQGLGSLLSSVVAVRQTCGTGHGPWLSLLVADRSLRGARGSVGKGPGLLTSHQVKALFLLGVWPHLARQQGQLHWGPVYLWEVGDGGCTLPSGSPKLVGPVSQSVKWA